MKIVIASTQESNENTKQYPSTSIISLAEIPLLLRIIATSDSVRVRKVPGFTFQSQVSFVETEVH